MAQPWVSLNIVHLAKHPQHTTTPNCQLLKCLPSFLFNSSGFFFLLKFSLAPPPPPTSSKQTNDACPEHRPCAVFLSRLVAQVQQHQAVPPPAAAQVQRPAGPATRAAAARRQVRALRLTGEWGLGPCHGEKLGEDGPEDLFCLLRKDCFFVWALGHGPRERPGHGPEELFYLPLFRFFLGGGMDHRMCFSYLPRKCFFFFGGGDGPEECVCLLVEKIGVGTYHYGDGYGPKCFETEMYVMTRANRCLKRSHPDTTMVGQQVKAPCLHQKEHGWLPFVVTGVHFGWHEKLGGTCDHCGPGASQIGCTPPRTPHLLNTITSQDMRT